MNKRLLNIFIIVVLVVLIFIRLIHHNASEWISCLNYTGLGIAVLGFLSEFSSRYKHNKTANFIKGILVLILTGIIAIGCFIFTGIIQLNTLANDEILLFTLLVSLPTNYYCELLGKIVAPMPQGTIQNK